MTMDRSLRLSAAIAAIACLALTIRGLWGMTWPSALPWEGVPAFTRYLGYVIVIAVLVFTLSKFTQKSPLAVGVTLAIGLLTIAGALWPMIVTVWFFLASWLLGRRVIFAVRGTEAESNSMLHLLIGAGIFATVVGLLAHFSVNSPGLYGVILLFSIFLDRKQLVQFCSYLYFQVSQKRVSHRADHCLDTGLVVVALVYVAVGLMPEIMYDALALHLFIPSQLAHRGFWGFDVSTYVGAVMPKLADWIYSIGYMMGGEATARLINIGFVFVLASLTRDLALWAGAKAISGRLAALILLLTPMTFTQGSSLHVEGIWAAFLIGSILTILQLTTSQRGSEERHIITVAILLGCALATKVITVLILPLLAGLLIFRWRQWANLDLWRPIIVGLLVFSIIGGVPYVEAWGMTGNPIFPFFNGIFQSTFYPIENFKDSRWHIGLTWDLLYEITFSSNLYQEAKPGAPGFQWLLMLVPAILYLIGCKNGRGIMLVMLGSLFVVLVFSFTSYLRYVFPAVPMLGASIVLAIDQIASNEGRFGRSLSYAMLAMLLLLNFLFFSAASPHRDFQIKTIFDLDARKDYLIARVPERAAVDLVNALNVTGNPVMFLAEPFGAGLKAEALYANWYNRGLLDAIVGVQSKAQALDLLMERQTDFVILAKKEGMWADGKLEAQRSYIESVTLEIAAYGAVSVRQINPSLLFQSEILKNPDFKSKDGWDFSSGALFEPSTYSVVVSEHQPVTQSVIVKPGNTYRNVVIARCAARPAVGRLQINWHDMEWKFLKADINTFDCSVDWSEHIMMVTAPPMANHALVYTSGLTTESLSLLC